MEVILVLFLPSYPPELSMLMVALQPVVVVVLLLVLVLLFVAVGCALWDDAVPLLLTIVVDINQV